MTSNRTVSTSQSRTLRSLSLMLVACGLATIATAAVITGVGAEDDWAVHDMKRPQPKVVTPVQPSCNDSVGKAPDDAIVLFDGSDLDAWRSGAGAANWKVEDGLAIVNGGDIQTRQDFGDVQFHIEWMVPADRKTSGQAGGNSGVFFNNQYEIQILDAFENETYPDGTAGSFYGQHPPLVNPCRPKGQWNVYDIIYTAPRWDETGKLLSPARATVLFNGVLVQNNQAFWGTTAHGSRARYGSPHGKGLIRVQDHSDPIHFRNIWVRELDG